MGTDRAGKANDSAGENDREAGQGAGLLAHQLGAERRRQRAAIERFAQAHGYELVGEFYDAAVSSADPLESRLGFAAMLARIEGNSVRMVIVKDASRFPARSLAIAPNAPACRRPAACPGPAASSRRLGYRALADARCCSNASTK